MNGRPAIATKGCLEAYVSTAPCCANTQNRKDWLLGFHNSDAAVALKISRLAIDGDPTARKAYAALAGYLAEGIANIFNLFDPQAVLLAGALWKVRCTLLPKLRNASQSSCTLDPCGNRVCSQQRQATTPACKVLAPTCLKRSWRRPGYRDEIVLDRKRPRKPTYKRGWTVLDSC